MFKNGYWLTLLVASMVCSQGNGDLVSGNDNTILLKEERDRPAGYHVKQAVQGAKGEPGHPGARGEKGETGAQGEKGDKGSTGARGPRGKQGEKGNTGEKGAKGERGEHGPKGAKGEKGEKGAKGDKGERGPHGKRGPQGKQGPKGASDFAHPLSADLFVDGATKVAKNEQNGSIARPFATIEQAIHAARDIEACVGNQMCRTVTILIASGFYNCCEGECFDASSASSTSSTSSCSSSSSSSSDDCGCNIMIIGNQKLALIALGPVTIGCTDDCGCQALPCNRPVGIIWVPVGGSCQGGVRPTLTISSLNGLAEAMTPYQSYSNKFRITGGITIINKNCCVCDEGDVGCIANCNETISVSTSTSTSESKCSESFSCSESASASFGSNNSMSIRHHASKRKRDGHRERHQSSSDRLHVSSDGSKEWHHSVKKEQQTKHGTFKRLHRRERGEISSDADVARVHHSTSYEVITRHGHRHTCSSSHTSYTSVSSELECPDDCAMCNEDETRGCAEACQVQNLCCTQGCLPAELSFNGELFGDLAVTGRVMLYFTRARIHGFVAASTSDIVVADRARFDTQVTVNFYGTVQSSEFLGGLTLTGCELLDPCCISVFLQGFFTTYLSGPITGVFCGFSGSQLKVDLVTFSTLRCGLSSDCIALSNICVELFDGSLDTCTGTCHVFD